MKHKKETYLKILNHFKASQDVIVREFMRKINNYNDKTFTTNGHSLLLTPCVGEYTYKDISFLFPEQKNTDKIILLSELKQKLEYFPKVDCFDMEQTKCSACYGCGNVDYEFNHGRKTFLHSEECPVCEGEGVILTESKTPNGKKDYDDEKTFMIGDCLFLIDRILELLFVAETLNSDIRVVFKTDTSGHMIFEIDDVILILMPCLKNEDSIAVEIKL